MVAQPKPPIPATVKALERVLKDRPVLWVGAGLSIGAGYPSTADLARLLCEQADDELDPNQDFAALVDAFVESVGRAELHELISREYDGTVRTPTPLHLELARLAGLGKFSVIFTSNQDSLIEDALKQNSVPCVVQTLEQNPHIAPDMLRVVKLYGSHTDWAEAIESGLSRESFDERYSFLIDQLDIWLQQRPVVFVGCSLRDPRVIDWLVDLPPERAELLKRWRPMMTGAGWQRAVNAHPTILSLGNIRPLIIDEHERHLLALWRAVDPAPQSNPRSPRLWGWLVGKVKRHRALSLSIAALVVAVQAALFVLYWPSLTIAPFSVQPGIVIAERWTDDSRARAHLCSLLRAKNAQGVQCVDLRYVGDQRGELRRAAARAEAALAAVVHDHSWLTIAPVPGRSGGGLLAGLPALYIGEASTREQVADILLALAYAASSTPMPDGMRVEIPGPERFGWQITALAAFSRQLTDAREWPPADDEALRVTVTQCRRPNRPIDPHCALAMLVLAERMHPDSQLRHSWLRDLARRGVGRARQYATFLLIKDDCTRAPENGADVLVWMANRFPECAQYSLMHTATCFLEQTDIANGAIRQRLRDLARPGEHARRVCTSVQLASFLQDRAYRSYFVRGKWREAARDYHEAADLQPSKAVYLSSWAESLLRLDPLSRADAERIASDLLAQNYAGSDKTRALVLVWLATGRDEHRRALCAAYDELAEGEVAMREVDPGLMCGPETSGVHAARGAHLCAIYRALAARKSAATSLALKDALCGPTTEQAPVGVSVDGG